MEEVEPSTPVLETGGAPFALHSYGANNVTRTRIYGLEDRGTAFIPCSLWGLTIKVPSQVEGVSSFIHFPVDRKQALGRSTLFGLGPVLPLIDNIYKNGDDDETCTRTLSRDRGRLCC